MGVVVGVDLGIDPTRVRGVGGSIPGNGDTGLPVQSTVGPRRRGGRNGGEREILVGTMAYDNWDVAPKDTILSVKQLLGCDVGDSEVIAPVLAHGAGDNRSASGLGRDGIVCILVSRGSG